MDEDQKDEILAQSYPVTENSSDKENKSEAPFTETRDEKPSFSLAETTVINQNDDLAQDDTSDEGWQEAVPKGRSLAGRKSSGPRRPSLAKLNTNSMNVSQSSRYRGKPTGFASPRTSPNESSTPTGSVLPVPKKFSKSLSFSPKQNAPTTSGTGLEKLSNPKSAPGSPAASDQVSRSAPLASPISVQAAGKLFSYKEVALAPPGTIVKIVTEQLPKENISTEQNPQVGKVAKETPAMETAQGKEEKAAKDGEGEHVGEKKLLVTEQETEGVGNEEKQVADSSAATEEKRVEAEEVSEVKRVSVEQAKAEAEAEAEAVTGFKNFDSSNDLKATDSKSDDILEKGLLDNSLVASPVSEPQSVLTDNDNDNATLLLENNTSLPKEKGAGGDDSSHDLPNGDGSSGPSSTEGEKQDEADTGKETKKLSAAAPPFNPSTIPVFGSVPVPLFKEHGGILPPPVNIPPMLTVNPVRRSPHQSATARVPYGPRLSGGYNRSGSRVPRNKPGYHNPEHNGDATSFTSPRVMNPHAAEFVPGQPWVPNGYPMSPNGYLASPNGIAVSSNSFPPISPNGIPLSPNGFPPSLNGVPAIENEFPASPVSSVDSPTVETVETGAESKSEVPEEGNTQEASTGEGDYTNQPSEHNVQDGDQSGDNEKIGQEIEEKPAEIIAAASDNATVAAKENCNNSEVVKEKEKPGKIGQEIEEKPAEIVAAASDNATVSAKENCNNGEVAKCWGDYSDSESEIVEVTS